MVPALDFDFLASFSFLQCLGKLTSRCTFLSSQWGPVLGSLSLLVIVSLSIIASPRDLYGIDATAYFNNWLLIYIDS